MNSSNSKNCIFQAQNIRKVYKMGEMEVIALQSISIQFFKSEFVVMLGPSGSGKSTLLNILGGLDTPSSGKVLFKDEELFLKSDEDLTKYRREHVGFVFQFYNLIPSLTAQENVQLVTDISSHPLDSKKALDLVGILDRKDHFPTQLSGGEQQRVAIARAISKNPDILLCDEPTGALDFQTGAMVLDAIERVNKELGTTTIIITHNETIAQIADRVIKMKDGMIVSDEMNKKKKSVSELRW